MTDTTKRIAVGEANYLIRRMDATVGSYVLGIVLTAMRNAMLSAMAAAEDAPQRPVRDEEEPAEPSAPETPEEQAAKAVRFALMALGLDETRKMHRMCLDVVSKVQDVNGQEALLPVLMASGVFAIPELQTDIPTVLSLVAQALIFNLTPFFAAGGLGAILRG